MKMKIFAIIFILLLSISALAADYGDGDTSQGFTFTYYRIETEDMIYYCESYEVNPVSGELKMEKVFIEGQSKEYSEFTIVPKTSIISIQKKTGESKEDVIQKNASGCFINTISQ